MNTENVPNPNPQPSDINGDTIATAYVAAELIKARKELKRTRIIGLVLVGVVGAYITIISSIMVSFFQPGPAAQVASGMLMQHVSTDGKALTEQVERQIPLLIRQLPDYAIQQLPRYRQDLESTLESEIQDHCDALSADVGYQVDLLIDNHHGEIKEVLTHRNDRAALRKALPDLGQTITTYLAADPEGQAFHQRITDLAIALKNVETRIYRLAYGKNLTPEEQTARRSLAVLAQAIDNSAKPPLKTSAPTRHLASN